MAKCGLTGELVTQRLLAECQIDTVQVVRKGHRDLYHPWKREIRLSASTHGSPSLLAVAIAAHEVGHAQQFAEKTPISRIRQVALPICWVGTFLAVLLPLLPLFGCEILSPDQSITFLLVVVVSTLLVQLPIHLPLEYDASRRARRLVQATGLVTADEQAAFDKVLKAAWLTYAAAEAQRWIIVLVAAAVLLSSSSVLHTTSDGVGVGETQSLVAEVTDHHAERNVFNHSATANENGIQSHSGESPMQLPTLLTESSAIDVNSLSELPNFFFILAWLPNIVAIAIGFQLLRYFSKLANSLKPKRTGRDTAIERSNRGLELYEEGKYSLAIVEFNEALRIDSRFAAAYYNRGQVHFKLGQSDSALADCDSALAIEPVFLPALVARGDIWLQRGDYERALEEFNTAHQLSPQNATVLTCRGFAWIARGELVQASADFELALKFNPKEPLAYAGRAMLWLAKGNIEQSLADCSQAASLSDRDPVIFSTRGRARLDGGDYLGAIEDFTVALRLDANDATVMRDRGLTWYYRNEFERALADLDESIRHDGTDPTALNNRGATLLKMGEYTRAAADLHEAIRLDPSFPNPYKHLAVIEASCRGAAAQPISMSWPPDSPLSVQTSSSH